MSTARKPMPSNNQSTERTQRTSDLILQYNQVFKRTEQIPLQHKWSSDTEDPSADIPSGESDADVVEPSLVTVQKPVPSGWAVIRGNNLQQIKQKLEPSTTKQDSIKLVKTERF